MQQSLSRLETGQIPNGFSSSDLAALNTAAIDTTGANYANAARAVGGQLAGRGGDAGLESGIDQQIKAGIASSAGGQLSTEENNITQANFNAGRQDLMQTIGGQQALAGIQDPLGFAKSGNEANSTAFGEANSVNQQNNQVEADIAGGVEGLAGAATNFLLPGTKLGGSSPNPSIGGTLNNPYFTGDTD